MVYENDKATNAKHLQEVKNKRGKQKLNSGTPYTQGNPLMNVAGKNDDLRME